MKFIITKNLIINLTDISCIKDNIIYLKNSKEIQITRADLDKIKEVLERSDK